MKTETPYIDLDKAAIEHLFNGDLILLVTATDLETEHTHRKITPLSGYEKIIRVFEGNHTYYLGVFGCYKVLHVQCSMGSIARDSSIMTVSTSLTTFKIKIVVMIGIAFGVNDKEQKIGDVLIAESVIPYNVKRVGEKRTIRRGMEGQSSQVLLNRFKNINKRWEHFISDDVKADLSFTRLLSGEELVDNLEYRNSLISEFPDSKGGEMEGIGLHSACGKIDWILVKGICDFADGNKNSNKVTNQQIAIESALSACLEVFNSPLVFKELNVLSVENVLEVSTQEDLDINDVLFDFYDATKENYYVKRDSDDIFSQIIKQYGVWIHGPSGCGKSNLIIRNLIENKTPFLQVNLVSCIGQEVQSFFTEILYEIGAHCENVHVQAQPLNFTECNKAIVSLLSRYFLNQDFLIFIEEIPIDSDSNQKEFIDKFLALVILKKFNAGLNRVRFVLSSLDNPTVNISRVQQKIHEYMAFLELEYWNNEQIVILIDIILKEFKIVITEEFKKQLIGSAKGSPRFIKKFFRSVYTLNKSDEATLKVILKETERELSLRYA